MPPYPDRLVGGLPLYCRYDVPFAHVLATFFVLLVDLLCFTGGWRAV